VPDKDPKLCHLATASTSWVEEASIPNPLKPGAISQQIQPRNVLGRFPCDTRCVLYDKAAGECLDVLEKRAAISAHKEQKRIADILVMMDGYQRQGESV
jgi:hypothetical protein